MKILSQWLRSYLPGLAELPTPPTDRQLADDLTLRGIAVEGVFSLVEDAVPGSGYGAGSLFETDITTNRVDAMNHYGVAREAAAIYGVGLAALEAALPAPQPGEGYPVRIDAAELCGRFTARILRNITIRPSTGIVAERFRHLGQKMISNAVDATNYVTLAMGHPTHAFDLDKLDGGIVVRRARAGEKLRTLDGEERTLDADDLVVADERKAVGLAGVMGGWDTMITPETRNVLIEAAWFDPGVVRRMSRRHGIHSDASHRFERGADFNAPPVASGLVAQIILEAGGQIEGRLTDVVVPAVQARTEARPPIPLRISEVHRLLGPTEDRSPIGEVECTEILSALGCVLAQTGPGEYAASLPSWRLDLEREIDLIEEIARVYGYNRFANTLPAFTGTVIELPQGAKESAVRTLLLGSGYNEAISSTFCSAADAGLFAPVPASAVPMQNPLSEEAGMLRPSLLPGMLTMLAHNLNRNVDDARLFEMGTVFTASLPGAHSSHIERVDERPSLAWGATGHLASSPLHPARPVDFYDLKGLVEALLDRFSYKSAYFDAFPENPALTPGWLHPGRAARCVLDGRTLAWFGELHPGEAERRKLRQPVYLGEIYLDRLYRQELRQPVVREISRYQPVQRDFSFIFPDPIGWHAVESALDRLAIPELASWQPAEIFRDAKGKTVPPQHYSVLVRTVFQSAERTLREEELQAWSREIVGVLEGLGGQWRAQ
jgi:phenylalanyl-tRNA synthetase beta chain